MQNAFETREKPGSAAMSGWLGLVGLLLIAVSTWIGFDLLQSGGPLRDRTRPLRASWYLRSGQWRADLRTLVAAVAYVVDQDKSAGPKNIPVVTAQWPEPAGTTTISVLRIRLGGHHVDLQANPDNPV